MLCKWGLFRESVDYIQWAMYGDQIAINQIAQGMANNMSLEEVEEVWDSRLLGRKLFMRNHNPFAITLLSRANIQYRQEKQNAFSKAARELLTSDLIGELPNQPDRKVCMTCGERVDGVIYCSEQCRPSASLEWYSHRFNRAETQTLTEGFRTARSRFMSPSADSCATYDTTQFVPPPYGLVDANPPTPKFVPTKEEPQEEGGLEELTLYSGPEKEPAWPSFVAPAPPDSSLGFPWGTTKLPPIRSVLNQDRSPMEREFYRPLRSEPYWEIDYDPEMQSMSYRQQQNNV